MENGEGHSSLQLQQLSTLAVNEGEMLDFAQSMYLTSDMLLLVQQAVYQTTRTML